MNMFLESFFTDIDIDILVYYIMYYFKIYLVINNEIIDQYN